MARCPRCNEPIKPFSVLGVDVTSRSAFALAGMVAFLVFDLLIIVPASYATHMSTPMVLLILSGAGLIRFAVFYGLLWPRALHACHNKRTWKDIACLAVTPLVLSSASFWMWAGLRMLWLHGP